MRNINLRACEEYFSQFHKVNLSWLGWESGEMSESFGFQEKQGTYQSLLFIIWVLLPVTHFFFLRHFPFGVSYCNSATIFLSTAVGHFKTFISSSVRREKDLKSGTTAGGSSIFTPSSHITYTSVKNGHHWIGKFGINHTRHIGKFLLSID